MNTVGISDGTNKPPTIERQAKNNKIIFALDTAPEPEDCHGMEIDRTQITVVFKVADFEAAKILWAAHKDEVQLNGLVPVVIAWGRQLKEDNE